MRVCRFFYKRYSCLGIVAIVSAFLVGALAPVRAQDATDDDETPPGLWWPARRSASDLTDEERAQLEQLKVHPYLSGYEPAPEESGVVVYDPSRAQPGVNLYNSGHAPTAVAIDMDGDELHRWGYNIDDVWPDARPAKMAHYWRRVHLYPNGDLVAMFSDYGLVRLDRDSRLKWAWRARCHHDLFVAPDRRIFTIRRKAEMVSGLNYGRGVLTDYISVLNDDGELQNEISILDCFTGSRFEDVLASMPVRDEDVLHTNSIVVLDGSQADRSPVLAKGNLLISMRAVDALAIIDPRVEQVVWAVGGRVWSQQHDPQPLPNGHLLVFDNLGGGPVKIEVAGTEALVRSSRVIEVDLRAENPLWEFRGAEDQPLYSRTNGALDPLANGDVLISESNFGRAVEVTRDKEVVWEWVNPHRAGEENELIATLFEMQRVDSSRVEWLWEGQ